MEASGVEQSSCDARVWALPRDKTRWWTLQCIIRALCLNHTLQKDSRGALVTSFLQIFLLFYFHDQVVRLPLNLNETSRKKTTTTKQYTHQLNIELKKAIPPYSKYLFTLCIKHNASSTAPFTNVLDSVFWVRVIVINNNNFFLYCFVTLIFKMPLFVAVFPIF